MSTVIHSCGSDYSCRNELKGKNGLASSENCAAKRKKYCAYGPGDLTDEVTDVTGTECCMTTESWQPQTAHAQKVR